MMKLVVAGALALAVLLTADRPAGAETRTGPEEPRLRCDDSRTAARSRARRGRTEDRACALEYLVEIRRYTMMVSSGNNDGVWPELIEGAERLNEFYLARSERQQTFLNRAAATTGIGAAGATLSSAAGASTVRYWGYGALIPVAFVNFHANEPTRDLYYAGHIGLQLILDRYMRLNNRLAMLRMELDHRAARTTELPTCEGLSGVLNEVESWPAGDDRSAFLPAVRDVATACQALAISENNMRAFVRAAELRAMEWPYGLASDALALDYLVADRDNRLRTTPARAFSSSIVAPLRAVDSLVSGSNPQGALNALATNEILDDARVLLHPIELPPAPTTSTTAIVYPVSLEARATAPGEAARVRAVNDWLRERIPRIEQARRDQSVLTTLAADIREAAIQSQLTFDYQVQTGMVSVVIKPQGTTAARVAPSEPEDEPVMAQPSPAAEPKL